MADVAGATRRELQRLIKKFKGSLFSKTQKTLKAKYVPEETKKKKKGETEAEKLARERQELRRRFLRP